MNKWSSDIFIRKRQYIFIADVYERKSDIKEMLVYGFII